MAVEAGSERFSLPVIWEFDGNDERIVCLIVHEPSGVIAMASQPFRHQCQVARKIFVGDPNHDSAHSANPPGDPKLRLNARITLKFRAT
ncbi:MAG: hypothetical protein WA633_13285 [Stellaceae bacterium]